MQKDPRPYWVKKAYLGFRSWYVRNYLEPSFACLGGHGTFMKPWYIRVNGPNIRLGKCATVVAERDRTVSIGVWGDSEGKGEITIGDYVMISPGVRITAAESIVIGDSCMMANGAFITDSDWHGVYDRVGRDDAHQPVVLEDNVWIGDHAIVLKGVTVGRNSIVAAGSVVARDVPANVVVAGSPARVVKELDEEKGFKTRAGFFSDPVGLAREYDKIDQLVLKDNSTLGWLKRIFWPRSQ